MPYNNVSLLKSKLTKLQNTFSDKFKSFPKKDHYKKQFATSANVVLHAFQHQSKKDEIPPLTQQTTMRVFNEQLLDKVGSTIKAQYLQEFTQKVESIRPLAQEILGLETQ